MFGKNPFNEYRATQQQVQERTESECEGMVCKNCGDKFGMPTEGSCMYDSKNPNGKNWMEATNEGTDSVNEKFKKENNYIHAAKMAKSKGDKTFTIGGKEYDVEEALKTEDNTNDKSDDGDGLDKVQPKAVKKKFADRKDKDIDNDGDTDSSDEFLHKKRKAISKSIEKDGNTKEGYYKDKQIKAQDKSSGAKPVPTKKKKINSEKEGDVAMNPKMEAAGYTDVDTMKGKGGAQVKIVKDKKGNHVALFSGKGSTQVPIKKVDKKVLQKALDSFSKNGMIGNTLSSIEEKASIRMRLTSFLNEKNQNPNAEKAEKPEDAVKGKGAKDMMEPAKNAEINDTEEKGHDDASKAGRVTKPASSRNGGDAVRSGDQKIVSGGTKAKTESYDKMSGLKSAYASMYESKVESEEK